MKDNLNARPKGNLQPFPNLAPKPKNVPPTKLSTAVDDVFSSDRNTITNTVISVSEGHENGVDSPSVGHDTTSKWSKQDIGCLANHLMVDTLALELPDVELAKLTQSFARTDTEGDSVPDSGWSKGTSQSFTGKSTFRLFHSKSTQKLAVEGSCAGHFQGQNVVSSGDVEMLAFAMMREVNREHSLGLSPLIGWYLVNGRLVEVTRIDVVLLLKVPKGMTKAAFINDLAIAGIKAGINTSLYINETVYFDQNSQVEAMKAYDKEAELNRARKGGLPDVEGVSDLEELIHETVRLEFVFRKKLLTRIAAKHGGLPHPCLFTKKLLAEMVLAQLDKFVGSGSVMRRLNAAELNAVSLPYRSTLAHWQNCENLLDMVKSERVLKTHARYLWRNHRINIDAPPPDETHVPMPLSEILVPENFIPVPTKISNNPNLFFELDMVAERASLHRRVGRGISTVLVDPYRLPDEFIEVDGKRQVI